MSLTQLSTELLLLIASSLSQRDLLNVSITSKRLHAAIEPALYREYHPPSLRRRPISLFIRALLKDPTRQHYVHSLRLLDWETLDLRDEEERGRRDCLQRQAMAIGQRIYRSVDRWWDPHKVPGQGLTLEDYDLYTNAALATGLIKEIVPYGERPILVLNSVEKFEIILGFKYSWNYFSTVDLESLPFDEKFCHLLRAGVDDAYVVLLGSLLRNLRRIRLCSIPTTPNKLPWTRALRHLSNLQEFTAISPYEYPFRNDLLSFWVDVLKIPTLKLFRSRGCVSWWSQNHSSYEHSRFSLSSHISNLRRLLLADCELEYRDLKLLLRACRSLESVQFFLPCRKGAATSAQLFDLLAPFEMTLKDLVLNMGSASHGPYSENQFQDQPISSLARFTRLETLWIPTTMWANLPEPWEIYRDPSRTITFAGLLPPSLKRLTFVDTHAYPILTQPVLDGLLELAHFELLELTTLDVSSQHTKGCYEVEITEGSKQVHRDCGSTFNYRFWCSWYPHRIYEVLCTPEELAGDYSWSVETTRWDVNRYVTGSLESLKQSNLLTKDEEMAVLNRLMDAPTYNDEIYELLEREADEAAAKL